MSEYYSIITDAGAALEAAAAAGGPPVVLTQFAVGDGGGAAVIPNPMQVALVNEVYRGNLSSLTTGEQPNVLVAQGIIPMESGGYTIREVGIFTQEGTLYSVSNYPDQVKPAPESGYAAKLGIEYLLQVSSTSDITLIVSPQDYLTEERANTLYVNVAGDTMTGTLSITQDGSAIIIQADSPGANNFIKSLDSDGSNNWFVGYGNAGENTLSLWNYKTGAGVDIGAQSIFNQAIGCDNVSAGSPVAISGPSPTIRLTEAETGKQWFLVADGTGIRLDENNTATSVWAWDGSIFTVTGILYSTSDIRAAGTLVGTGGVTSPNDIYSDRNIHCLGILQATQGVFDTPSVRVYSPNNPPPASAGDSYSDTMLGAARWQDYVGGGQALGGAGEVLTGLQEQQDDNEIHGYWWKPIQKNVNGAWYTIAG